MWEFNFGEWSEAYVFLRLLGDGRIYAADENFDRNQNVYLDILSIIRYESDHILEFKREINETFAYDNKAQFCIITNELLNKKADFLYAAIRNITSNNRKFSVPDIESFLKELNFSQPKVPPLPLKVAEQYGKKTDIIIQVKDSIDHAVSTTGFSIKSHLGSASSLFNSSLASKMTYEVVGCDDFEMNYINGTKINSEIGMIKYIRDHQNLSLNFIGTSEAFYENLTFIDLTMSEILGCLMLIQIGYYDRADSSKTSNLVKKLSEINPIKVKNPDKWYEAKIKDFLYDSFSGLTASEPWDGKRRLSGGYINVNTNGEILFYRAVSDDIFSTFLFENTFVDRPSRGVNKNIAKVISSAALENRIASEEEIYSASTNSNGRPKSKKGDWGYIYKIDNKYYLDINFQIRFR